MFKKMFMMTAIILFAASLYAAATENPELADIKGRSRISVSSGKDLKKEFYKYKNRGGSYLKNLQTAKTAIVKIRNITDKPVKYAVHYYFVAEPFGDNNAKSEIFDQGCKSATCEPSCNLEMDITSKTATGIDHKPGSAAPRQKSGKQIEGYMIIVKVNNEEIFSYNSRHNDKFEKSVRELINAQKQK